MHKTKKKNSDTSDELRKPLRWEAKCLQGSAKVQLPLAETLRLPGLGWLRISTQFWHIVPIGYVMVSAISSPIPVCSRVSSSQQPALYLPQLFTYSLPDRCIHVSGSVRSGRDLCLFLVGSVWTVFVSRQYSWTRTACSRLPALAPF